VKRYLLLATSFTATFVLFCFQYATPAQAWIKDNDPCDPNSEMTARQILMPFYQSGQNNSIPQSAENNSCVYPQSVCTPDDKFNNMAGSHCKPDPTANTKPGGGTKQTLHCTCTNPNSPSPQNGYTCKNDAGQVVNTDTGDKSPTDFCRAQEQCQPGSPTDIRGITLSGDTKFDTNKYIISGVICKATKGTAACTCDPNDKTKVHCPPNPPPPGAPAPPAPQGGTDATCNDNFQCSPLSDKNREVDRGQLKDGRTFMQDYTLQGIECKRKTATCSCIAPNKTGAGGMNCLVDGKPPPPDAQGNPLRPACQDQYACVPNPNGSDLLDGNTLSQPGSLASMMIMGVKCVNGADPSLHPPTPTIPDVPPPPCATKQGADGVCNSFLTAFGAIDTNVQGFILRIFAILLSVSGGIAVLLIMRAGYLLMTSSGNPERVKEGREQLIAAIVGLLFIIFSFVILQVIGIDILKVPGFAG
jgi:hypothetical protein